MFREFLRRLEAVVVGKGILEACKFEFPSFRDGGLDYAGKARTSKVLEG